MIVTLLMVVGILYLALQLEDKFSIPSPLGLIGLSFAIHYGFSKVPVLTGDADHFAALVVFLLPVLLISDSLELKLADLKAHGVSLMYLAVVAVLLSVGMALLSTFIYSGILLFIIGVNRQQFLAEKLAESH